MRTLRYAPLYALTAFVGLLGAGTGPANATTSACPNYAPPGEIAFAHCTTTITFNSNGTISGLLTPQSETEDNLVGVINNSGHTVNSVSLFGGTVETGEAFDFDDDFGLTNGPTGYEGPNTSFSDICVDLSCGTVNFTGGLADGATAYFGLESSPGLANLDHGTSGTTSFDFVLIEEATVPEPATLALFGAGLMGLGAMRRRRKSKA